MVYCIEHHNKIYNYYRLVIRKKNIYLKCIPALQTIKIPCEYIVLIKFINTYIASFFFLRELGHNRISEVPSHAFSFRYLGFLYVDIEMCVDVQVTYSRPWYTSITGNQFSSNGAWTEVSCPYLKLISALLFELARNRNVFFIKQILPWSISRNVIIIL